MPPQRKVCSYTYVCTVNQEIFIQDFFVFTILMVFNFSFLFQSLNVKKHFQFSNFSFFGWQRKLNFLNYGIAYRTEPIHNTWLSVEPFNLG